MLADFGTKFDLRVLLFTTIAVLVMSVAGAVLNAALGGGRTPCAYAAGSVCEGDIVVYEYAEDVVVTPGNTIQINGSLLAVNNGSANVTIHQILAGAVGDALTMIRKAGATGTVTIDSDCGSATADVICLPGNQDWVIDSLYDSINFVKRPGSEFWTQVSRTDNVVTAAPVNAARVYNNADISIPSATYVTLTYNSEYYDVGGLHSTSSNTGRMTAPVAGKYLIISQIAWAANANGIRYQKIVKNGVSTNVLAETQLPVPGSNEQYVQIMTEVNLNAGDYVEVWVWQNSGGNLAAKYRFEAEPVLIMRQLGN